MERGRGARGLGRCGDRVGRRGYRPGRRALRGGVRHRRRRPRSNLPTRRVARAGREPQQDRLRRRRRSQAEVATGVEG